MRVESDEDAAAGAGDRIAGPPRQQPPGTPRRQREPGDDQHVVGEDRRGAGPRKRGTQRCRNEQRKGEGGG